LTFFWQLRGELRKLWHPVVALAIIVAAGAICSLQASHARDPYPGPSLVDLTGCLRIAALQHATTIGFVLAGVLAGLGTADEAGSGAIADTILREPRRPRVVLLKLVTSCAALFGSVLLTTLALRITGMLLRAQSVPLSARSGSGAGDTVLDVACAAPAIILAAVLGLTFALLTRSALATIVLTTALFVLPLTILQDSVLWLSPTRWIVEWLHLDPFGQGVDYLADNSPFDHRGLAALVSGLLIAATIAILSAMAGPLLSWAIVRPTEHD